MGYGLDEDVGDLAEWYEREVDCIGSESMSERYRLNKTEEFGTTIQCAYCEKTFVKVNQQAAFCSNSGKGNCKDKYWNAIRSKK